MSAGLCECGCGMPAPIATQSRSRDGSVKGQPLRFIRGHAVRVQKPSLRRISMREHLLAHVAIDPETGCWLWTRSQNGYGYGQLTAQGRRAYAHRASYEEFVGPIPAGYQIDHLCRVRHCINPEHLEAVTQAENIRRSEAPTIVRWRNNVCKNGHSLADAYIWKQPSGLRRVCRTCKKLRNAQRKQAAS